MPQMAPMMWLLLFFIFLFTFMLFNILNYFNFLKMKTSNLEEESFKKNLNNNYLNWKW